MKASFTILTTLALSIAWGASAEDSSWYPSKWGPDDTLGAINELSPEGVVRAAKLVKTGKTYSLGVETGRNTPATMLVDQK